MSEINELVGELKTRYQLWRARTRSRSGDAPAFEVIYESSPDIEFTVLSPRSSVQEVPLHDFADVSVAWIQAHCAPEAFAQGRQCYLGRQVTRVHAHGARMTGTTKERGYCDQEIVLQNGTLATHCSCKATPVPVASPASAPLPPLPPNAADTPAGARTLACRHVVAILLAYINPSEARNALNAPIAATPRPPLVCPVTRQSLDPARPLYQCEQCGMCFSAEGWKFLQDADKGRCCGCDTRHTIKEVGGG